VKPDSIGSSLAQSSIIKQIIHGSEAVVGWTPGYIDQQPRIAAARSVRGYPLMVTVTATTETILAEWRRQVVIVAGVTTSAIIAYGFLFATLAWHARRREMIAQELRESEARLAVAKDAAEASNHAKSEFLASMSHELRTPLNAILGFSEIIKEETFGPVGLHKYVDYAADVHSSGRHLLDLINDILDLSKIDAGKVELHEEELSMAHVMDDSLSLVRERALRGGVALVEEQGAEGLPAVWADRRLLKQILLNLLSNAIKFTPAGGTVTTSLFADASGMGFIVRDTGIGMTEEDMQKAMSLYGQVDSRVSRKHRGTGLGLPISLSLAKLHGGDLIVQSAPDKGTTMTLRLPLSRRRDPDAGRRAA
jgi:signal transduction histidine kinase